MKRLLGISLAAMMCISMWGCSGTTASNPEATMSAAPMEAALTASSTLKVPQKQEQKSGVTVYSNEKASVDASNLAEGYVMVKYTGGKSVRIKVRVAKTGGSTYNYDLVNTGAVEIYPITEGNGKYTISVFEQIEGTKYASAYSCTVDVKLRHELAPFIYANQYANFTSSSQAVKTATDLVKDCKTDLEKIEKIYSYVISNITYDDAMAQKVISGQITSYVPNVDTVLANKKGICFDFASLMTAMLRSQGIPAKLVIGYAGTQYHAWLNVFVEGVGWVDKVIYFDGANWTLMDPTFVAGKSGTNKDAVMQYVGDGKNYTMKNVY